VSQRITTREIGELRRRAEEQLGSRPVSRSRASYELEVAQVELQLQHEQLEELRAELAAVRDRYHDLYEGLPIGLATLDAFGRIVAANSRLCGLIAVHHGELTGAALATFMSDDAADQLQQRLRELDRVTSLDMDAHLVRSDGEVVPVRLAIAPGGATSYHVAVLVR
jgi:PAS domain S-box-containing protein